MKHSFATRLPRVNSLKPLLLGLLVFATAGAFSPQAQARRMSGQTGFGLTLHPLNTTPSISIRHHLSDHQAAVALLGFDTAASRRVLIVGGKFYQAAHLEENLNFYVGLGGFLISDRAGGTTGTASTGIEVEALFGGEFFLSGLPNLGIQFETGIAMRTAGGVTFSTLGSGFLGGAIHYYF